MKKSLEFFASLMIIFSLILLFVACTGDNHQHSFGEWFQSEDQTCIMAGIDRRNCNSNNCIYFETRSGADPFGTLLVKMQLARLHRFVQYVQTCYKVNLGITLMFLQHAQHRNCVSFVPK